MPQKPLPEALEPASIPNGVTDSTSKAKPAGVPNEVPDSSTKARPTGAAAAAPRTFLSDEQRQRMMNVYGVRDDDPAFMFVEICQEFHHTQHAVVVQMQRVVKDILALSEGRLKELKIALAESENLAKTARELSAKLDASQQTFARMQALQDDVRQAAQRVTETSLVRKFLGMLVPALSAILGIATYILLERLLSLAAR